MRPLSALLGLGLAGSTLADPTWPSDVDEVEEIMYQLTSFGARKFADAVSPCSSEASGPGRQNAAEWLRTAFHDMSTANSFFHVGGLDASLQYELDNGENTGPGHKTTLQFMSPYVSPRCSLSDLVAMGVYMSVRSCGGPAIPLRAGRKDATQKGPAGVPQPQNSIFTFKQQFQRMGFTNEEMIQVTACGHTLGGVHKDEFPELMPTAGVTNGEASTDQTPAVFDNKVVTEYLAGKTQNPLVVGPSAKIHKNSDSKVFNSDGNKTLEAMADPDQFNAVCQKVLQKMIDVVPPGVTLTDPIEPYMVKPVKMQLTLANGGRDVVLSGYIRVRTTDMARESIKSISLTYKGRSGDAQCASASCTVTSTMQGVGRGFDDSFAFFPISATIPASSGISSFIITLNKADGTTETYDNNGEAYSLHDDVILQAPQSCVRGSSGALSLVAAVRNEAAAQGAKANVWYRVPQTNSPVPQLKKTTIDLAKGQCVGQYTLFSADYKIEGGLAYQAYVDVVAGGKSDAFKSVAGLGGTCGVFEGAVGCQRVEGQMVRRGVDEAKVVFGRQVNGTTTATTATSAPPVATPTPTRIPPSHRPAVGGYKLVSCWTEGSNVRALNGISFANDTMTLEKCMNYCSAYVYWGTEYGRECYCGNSLAPSSSNAPLTDCNMVCGGNSSDFCGAGNRIELYSTTSAPATPTPTATLTHKATVTPYTLVGCWTEGKGSRALDQKASTSGSMSNEACAASCAGYKYFGTEYGSECYCGSYIDETSAAAPLGECNMACGGDAYAYCGASNRLELYMNANATGGRPEQPPAAGAWRLATT
ncbi:hypothetical protein CDD82_1234 [Ophiocordyceps australis]|uniref:WSC domain-containing protein n=1 Tax=Ophiocordyceps australis TaxID=1399860 RepID=A0A2C5YKX0_9HYPO|nr:hypothetical protein CDD82_1234 [Ophiocordyceps australis]